MDARHGSTEKPRWGQTPHAEGQILYVSIHMWHLVKPIGTAPRAGGGGGMFSGGRGQSGDGGEDGNTAPQTCLVPSSLKRVEMDTLMPHIFYQNFKK